MDSRPIRTIQIHDHLRGKLCDLYENDCIFDKFECTFSGDGKCAPFSLKQSTFSFIYKYSSEVFLTVRQASDDGLVPQLLPHI